MNKTICTLLSVLALVFVFAAQGHAHTLWLNLNDHNPGFDSRFGARVHSYIGWGHRIPVDGFLEFSALKNYSLYIPDGQRNELEPDHSAGLLPTSIKLRQPGAYFLSAAKEPTFYTMYEKNGEIHHSTEPKSGLDNVILSLYSKQYAKSLIIAGDENKGLKTPVGHDLEIIPLRDPAELKKGEKMQIKVLYKGKPARFTKVMATYYGFSVQGDYAFATTTDRSGKAEIRVVHQGHWMIKAVKKTLPSSEYADLCNRMKYSATLTLGIGG